MSLLTQAILAEKYGLRLTVQQLGEVLDMDANTIYNQVAQGVFKVKTYLDGKRRFADFRDVADYLDAQRENATTAA